MVLGRVLVWRRALAILIACTSPCAPPPLPSQGTLNPAAAAADSVNRHTTTATSPAIQVRILHRRAMLTPLANSTHLTLVRDESTEWSRQKQQYLTLEDVRDCLSEYV